MDILVVRERGNERMDGWMDGRTDGQTDRQIDNGWMDGYTHISHSVFVSRQLDMTYVNIKIRQNTHTHTLAGDKKQQNTLHKSRKYNTII
jgi:hypothetical protein